MTALDQAFIKAFSQQGPSTVVLPRQSAVPTSESRSSPIAPKKEVASLPISDVFRDVLATLEQPSAPPPSPTKEKPSASPVSVTKEKPPALPASPTKTEAPPETFPWRSQAEAITGAWSTEGWQTSFDTPESVCIAESIDLPELAGTAEPLDPAPPIDAAKPVTLANSVGAEAERRVGAAVADTPVAAAVELPHHPVATATARPVAALAGAAVELPPPCNPINGQASTGNKPSSPAAPLSAFLSREESARAARLQAGLAGGSFHLAEGLPTIDGQGKRRVRSAGRRPDGGKLAGAKDSGRWPDVVERGGHHAVALRRAPPGGAWRQTPSVDADLARPRARDASACSRSFGWNETRSRRNALDHAVVEAVSNGLTLLTVHDPASAMVTRPADWSRLAPWLEMLKNHYEMVLVDLGPLENIESTGDLADRPRRRNN